MDMLFHFVFSVIVGMAVFRGKHKLSAVASLAFISIFIDADHFLGMTARGTFHNVFFVFLVPFMAFLVFYRYENRKSIKLQTYALLLMVMLAGHITADMFYGGGVKLLYLISDASFSAPDLSLFVSSQYSPFISRDGIALSIYALILLSAFFIEDFIYFFEEKHEKLRKAIKNAREDLF